MEHSREGPKREKAPPGVYRHHGRLWIQFYITGSDGRRVRHREATDATSPREAGKVRANRLTEHDKGERTIESRTLTVGDVLAGVLTDYEINGRSSLPTATGHVKAIEAALGAATLAASITTDRVQAMQAAWLRAGGTNATVNRRCNLLRRGLRLMVRARRLPFLPYIPRLREEKRRGLYLPEADRAAIGEHLAGDAGAIFALALLLPNRRGQLSRTLRRFVDLKREVIEWPASECKADENHTVPLEGDALSIVESAMAKAIPWCPFLFHGPGCKPGHKPSKAYGCVGNFRKAWTSACKAAGLPVGRKAGGYVFHHTRNTAATDLRASGLSERDCMDLGGWKTRAVFDHYCIGDTEDLRDRLAAARGRRGKVVALRKGAKA